MKKTRYGVDRSGKAVVAIAIDGDKVKVLSEQGRFASLNGKSMALRVKKEIGNLIADGTVMVKPGEAGYPNAVIDTLESMWIDVVG